MTQSDAEAAQKSRSCVSFALSVASLLRRFCVSCVRLRHFCVSFLNPCVILRDFFFALAVSFYFQFKNYFFASLLRNVCVTFASPVASLLRHFASAASVCVAFALLFLPFFELLRHSFQKFSKKILRPYKIFIFDFLENKKVLF